MRTPKLALSLALALIAVVAAPMQGQSTFKLLHGFLGGNDGANPTSGVIFGPNGYLYGVTLDGGAYNWGTVFSISPGGRYKLLYTFTGGADGASPNNQLTWVGTSLYGVTDFGGAYECRNNLQDRFDDGGRVHAVHVHGFDRWPYSELHDDP